MPPIDRFQLRVTARLAALELLLEVLIQRTPELRRVLETHHALDAEIAALGQFGLPDQPEVSDLVTQELQEAWRELLQRVLSPPG
jgi:hypothetical protein